MFSGERRVTHRWFEALNPSLDAPDSANGFKLEDMAPEAARLGIENWNWTAPQSSASLLATWG